MLGMLVVVSGLLQQSISFSSTRIGYIWWRDMINPTASIGKQEN
jgi:hypothetical protein